MKAVTARVGQEMTQIRSVNLSTGDSKLRVFRKGTFSIFQVSRVRREQWKHSLALPIQNKGSELRGLWESK